MPKPTIAQFRALAAQLDEQHPKAEPADVAIAFTAFVDADAKAAVSDGFYERRIAQELGWVRRQKERGRGGGPPDRNLRPGSAVDA